jgi:glycosyltransferase involved in cell wall biosynthesis
VLEPALARLTPVVQPFPGRRGMTGTAAVIARHCLRRAVRRLGAVPHALITAWGLTPVFGSCGEQVRVYWAQDDYVGGADLFGLNARLIESREQVSAAGADVLVAANPVVARTWRARGYDPLLIPFGVNCGAYRDVESAPRPDDVRIEGAVAGFVGRLNARTDLSLLEAVADRGRSLLLVGPRDPAFEPRRVAALLARPGVTWTGEKPFAALPGYLRMISVGLVPYATANAFNQGSFPLKTLEYLAAGRPVVATDLPATRWLSTDLITIADGAQAFADAVEKALDDPGRAALGARREFARQHDWSGRAAAIYAAITARAPAA